MYALILSSSSLFVDRFVIFCFFGHLHSITQGRGVWPPFTVLFGCTHPGIDIVAKGHQTYKLVWSLCRNSYSFPLEGQLPLSSSASSIPQKQMQLFNFGASRQFSSSVAKWQLFGSCYLLVPSTCLSSFLSLTYPSCLWLITTHETAWNYFQLFSGEESPSLWDSSLVIKSPLD